MRAIVPLFVNGNSLPGRLSDGRNTIEGGDDNDWIWGGGDSDRLDGQSGDDYIDGGAGRDELLGGKGDDVLRGGANNDTLRGGDDIDQLFGDNGTDLLFGDAGTIVAGVMVTENQRLLGGDGIDYLYAYSESTDESQAVTEAGLKGDELYGGSGNDWLYGGIRSDKMYGDSGDDTLQGDGVWGADYAANPARSVVGGPDLIVGGSGQDKLYGGGGNDELWGGADSDTLEGQGGSDQLNGGSGIDQLMLDTSSIYYAGRYLVFGSNANEGFDGHRGEMPDDNTADDNATDILLIIGTDSNDNFTIGQSTIGDNPALLIADPNHDRVYSATWRDASSTPGQLGDALVEQFRIAGLGGDDHLEFTHTEQTFIIQGQSVKVQPLVVSDLTARSKDWVGVIDGGDGDDTLIGSDARDRIDGGFGSDVLYGYGGDDQLWGDGGKLQGRDTDKDVLFGGSGHDDLLGGQGNNVLIAWSRSPFSETVTNTALAANGGRLYQALVSLQDSADTGTEYSFGVYVDENGNFADQNGNFFESSGDADNDGHLDADPTRPARKLEDTGLNRVLGGSKTDLLYGGTGLDFLYGNGAPEANPDRLIDRHGQAFQGLDGGVAGEEWKQYAQSTDRLWYYGGSNSNDTIHVDFVTEPGVLQGHHLITRLTENSGNFTFDAQVRLDFSATNSDGSLVWNANDAYYGQTLVGTNPLPEKGRLAGDVEISLLVNGRVVTVPTLHQAATIANENHRQLIDELNDNLKSVGLSNVLSARLAGEFLSLVRIDGQTNDAAAIEIVAVNDEAQAALGLHVGQVSRNAYGGSQGLGSLLPPEDDYLAILIDALAGDDHIIVGPTVTRTVWSDGGAGNDTIEHLSGAPILIDQTDHRDQAIGNGSPNSAYNLGVIASGSPTASQRTDVLFDGLTIDSPTDVDWYRFSLGSEYSGQGVLFVRSLAETDGLEVTLRSADQPEPDALHPDVVLRSLTAGQLSLAGLQANHDYVIKVRSNLIPTRYSLEFVTTLGSFTDQSHALQLPLPIVDYRSIQGLPIQSASDSVWYQFLLEHNTPADGKLVVNALSGAPVTVQLIGPDAAILSATTTRPGQTGLLDLASLDRTRVYYLKVSATGGAFYDLLPQFGGSELLTGFANRETINLGDPTVIDRRDILLGGPGNDILRGGSGEDWIFGGAGNDVLSGGDDQQAPDLLWGGDGDDILQIIPDSLPTTRGSARSLTLPGQSRTQTMLPTQSDRLDGGAGDDQLLFLGGDLDATGNPIPDNVAMRWNSVLHRYELTSRIWDTNGQTYLADSADLPAEVTSSAPNTASPWASLAFGQLPVSTTASFQVSVLNGSTVIQAGTIQVTAASTVNNRRFEDLTNQINVALRAANLNGEVVALARGGRLVLQSLRLGSAYSIELSAINSAAVALGFVPDATSKIRAAGSRAATYQQQLAFFTTVDIENSVIDTRAGDDEVHLAPETMIQGSEWGFGPGVASQRGNPNFVVRGGVGSDRLFGGAGDDVIDGGDGDDVISGGGGNDTLRGGGGRDNLAGDTLDSLPDIYETSGGTSNDQAANATLLSSAMLAPLAQGHDVPISASLSRGDTGDWYVMATPPSFASYGAAKSAQVLRSMIELNSPSGSGPLSLELYAAGNQGSGSRLIPVPLDSFGGVPDYYLIHIANPSAHASDAIIPAFGEYMLTLHGGADGIGGTTLVPGSSALSVIDTGNDFVPTYIRIGDFNKDGHEDFIGGHRTAGGGEQLLVYFGEANVTSTGFGQPDLMIAMPGALALREEGFAAGDFNGDQYSDLAIQLLQGTGISVKLLFGRDNAALAQLPRINLPTAPASIPLLSLDSSDITIDGEFYWVTNVGHQDADTTDDLLLSDGTDAYLLFGQTSWTRWTTLPDLKTADFSDDTNANQSSLDGFQITNRALSNNSEVLDLPNLWTTTVNRSTDAGHGGGSSLYFGNPLTRNYVTTPPQRVAGRASKAIDLTRFSPGDDISMTFNYVLRTENDPSYDQARVNISTSPDFPATGNAVTTVLSNYSGTSRLQETTTWRSATINLAAYAGQTIYLAFEFDSIDSVFNNFEGFYVDDVKFSAVAHRDKSDMVKFTFDDGLIPVSLTRVGNLDGVGGDEFAILRMNRAGVDHLSVLSYASSWQPGASLNITQQAAREWELSVGIASNYSILAPGNVIDGPLPDLILTLNWILTVDNAGVEGSSYVLSGDRLWSTVNNPLMPAATTTGGKVIVQSVTSMASARMI